MKQITSEASNLSEYTEEHINKENRVFNYAISIIKEQKQSY